MKLTCVLIIAVLFLTACQLVTADYSGDEQQYRAMRLIDAMRNFGDTRSCGRRGKPCPCCRGFRCTGSFCRKWQ
uniref:Conotoxin Leo-O2 n=1 Tax=Conus leopardus TaxID=101306 RepID=O16_CONLE|nr:RecName: Full=Conotoxin Leo-O2; Flags: Precursor [Conus leopardus]